MSDNESSSSEVLQKKRGRGHRSKSNDNPSKIKKISNKFKLNKKQKLKSPQINIIKPKAVKKSYLLILIPFSIDHLSNISNILFNERKKNFNPAGTRTQNPQIRSLVRFHCATGLIKIFI